MSGLFDRRHMCQYLIVPLEGDPTLVYARGGAHIEAVRRSVYVKDVRGSEGGRYAHVIARRLEELKLQKGKIGITGSSSRPHSDTLPANQFETLRQKLPNSNFVFADDLLHRLMHLKSDEEIERVKAAGKLCDAAVQAMAERAKPGVAEYQLAAAAAAHAIMDNGGEPHLLIIGSTPMANPRLFFGNPRPSGRRLRRGDIIISEIAAWYNGCSAQIGRPICVGDPPSDVEKFFKLVFEGFNAIAATLRPGNTLHDVRKAAQFFREHGYQSRPLIMHGLDIVTSLPQVRVDDVEAEDYEMIIKPRMCYMLEPNPIRPDGRLGIFYGNTLLITEGGHEFATNYPPILTVAK